MLGLSEISPWPQPTAAYSLLLILQKILSTIKDRMVSSSWGGKLVSLEMEKEQPLMCFSRSLAGWQHCRLLLQRYCSDLASNNIPSSNVSP